MAKQAWESDKSWDQTAGAKVVAVILVIAVGWLGFGQQAIDPGPERAVRGFFDALSKPGVTSNELTDYVNGTITSRVREALALAPGGTYTVTSVDQVSRGNVRVGFTHQGEEFTSEMPVRRVSGTWKLYNPFPRVTFNGETERQSLQFQLNSATREVMFTNQTYTLVPGVHTVTPQPPSSSTPLFWEPRSTTVKVAPSALRTDVDLEPRLTATATEELIELVRDNLNTCLESEVLRPSGCPNQVTPASNADLQAPASWRISPEVPSIAYVGDSTVTQPCFLVDARLTYEYRTTAGEPTSATLRTWPNKGCVRATPDLRLTWEY
ncbi:hypothetical protein [Aestuariimicrobium sp. Y1814]|uniref:hypothetical protein n=1 Tax=Aestuariimicrobium sp. Y1814 TaxID=3418742 RepID=UPI003DA78207